MKLVEIYRPGQNLEYFEFEYNDWDSDPSWDYDQHDANPVVVFRGAVSKTRDMYGTGDSPTGYEVEELQASYKHNGKQIPLDHFDQRLLDRIEDRAIDQVQRG